MSQKTTEPSQLSPLRSQPPGRPPKIGPGPQGPGGRGSGSGGGKNPPSGPEGEGPGGPKLWVILVVLMVLVGVPRLFSLSEKHVTFDQLMQMVDHGEIKSVTFQVDTILARGVAKDGKDGKDGKAAKDGGPGQVQGQAQVQGATPQAGGSEILNDAKNPEPIVRTGRLESAERDLIQKLNEKKVPYDSLSTPSLLVTIGSWLLPLVLFYFFASWLMRRSGGGLGGLGSSVFSFGKNKAQVYGSGGGPGKKDAGVTFADVAGQHEAKAELVEIIDFLRAPERYTRLGGRIPRGVLLIGPPGTGKTLLARAVSGEAQVPFFSISGSEFVEMFVGVGAARVRDLFAQAKAQSPCIIFIDELDAIGRARGVSGPVVSNEEREQTLDQLLTEMDGFDTSSAVIIMGATNRPEILDPALLRAGRFDRRVVVDRPTLEDRLEILQVHARKVVLGKDVRLEQIAALTAGLVGADLANLVNEAALLAARRQADAVQNRDFQEALERVVAGLERKSRRLSPKDKQQVAYHECGHALIATLLPGSDPVKKISIVPRGIGALGYTMQQPSSEDGDRYLLTRRELLDRITVLLGGRAAEQEMLADISTGAQDDLQRATSLARRMVMELGMSKALGLQAFDSGRGQFLDTGGGLGNREVSDHTARAIDEEVGALLEELYGRARGLIQKHRAAVETAAQELLTSEVLDGARFRELIGPVPAVPPAQVASAEPG